MNNSMAFWFDYNETGKEELAESKDLKIQQLHINMWKLPNNSRYCRFVDFGLEIEKAHLIKALYLYIPHNNKQNCREITESFLPYKNCKVPYEFIDLGKNTSQANILQAVFNEDYKTQIQSGSKYCDVFHVDENGDKLEFRIYFIDVDSDLFVKNQYNGLIFKLNLAKPKEKSYFRFRLVGENIGNFFRTQHAADTFLQSAMWKTEIIDLRINEKRNLNKSLIESFNGQFSFAQFKFFLMVPSSEEVESLSHGTYKRCRYLENDLWADYVNFDSQKLNSSSMISAYQWNDKEEQTHLNMMIKSKYEQANLKTIGLYLLIIGILSVSFNIISNYLFKWLVEK